MSPWRKGGEREEGAFWAMGRGKGGTRMHLAHLEKADVSS